MLKHTTSWWRFKLKILTVIGARPQFIKAAAVSREIKKHNNISEIIVHTGQHFDKAMSDIFFEEMDIPKPNYNLDVNGLTHGAMTGQMMEKLDPIIAKEEPDAILVYGDTNSTLAGALCGAKLHVPVAHVEAGLRSFNNKMPEEINRILVDRMSSILFCPTETAINNLNSEGYSKFGSKIVRSGDVMLDAALFYAKKSVEKSKIVKTLGLESDSYILATIHRAENTNDLERLNSIVKALNTISEHKRVVLPLHPRTKKIVENEKIVIKADVIDPVGYFDMLELIKNSSMIMTDSGGLQKEAYFFKKRCVTLRDETEWVELVKAGVNSVVGSDADKIITAFDEAVNKVFEGVENLYGDGRASKTIVDQLLSLRS